MKETDRRPRVAPDVLVQIVTLLGLVPRLSIRAIAERCGVAEATVKRYRDSKQARAAAIVVPAQLAAGAVPTPFRRCHDCGRYTRADPCEHCGSAWARKR